MREDKRTHDGRSPAAQQDTTEQDIIMQGLTSLVQQSLDAVLAGTIIEDNRRFEDNIEELMAENAAEIISFVSDRRTINTPGFVIRRFIQRHRPELCIPFRAGEDFADLDAEGNVAWPEEIVTQIAGALYQTGKKEQDLRIPSSSWHGYLTDTQRPQVKSGSFFRVVFVLRMTREATNELLLSCNEDTYNVRNPLHLVCLFCQGRERLYRWQTARMLLARYQTETANLPAKDGLTGSAPAAGYTALLSDSVDALLSDAYSDEDACDALTELMIANHAQLTGFSVTRRGMIKRLTRYLRVFYTSFDSYNHNTYRANVPVGTDEDGAPNMADLIHAMFQAHEWESAMRGKKTVTDNRKNNLFFTQISLFCRNFYQHMNAVDRALRAPENAERVERRDVLLFAFFFIIAYLEADAPQIAQVEALASENGEIDRCIRAVTQLLTGEDGDEAEGWLSFRFYRRCLNLFLQTFGFRVVYEPLPFDRFILLSLAASGEEQGVFASMLIYENVAPDGDI